MQRRQFLPTSQAIHLQTDKLRRTQVQVHCLPALLGSGHHRACRGGRIARLIRFPVVPHVPQDQEHLPGNRDNGFFARAVLAEVFKASFPLRIVHHRDPGRFDHGSAQVAASLLGDPAPALRVGGIMHAGSQFEHAGDSQGPAEVL